MSFKITVGNNKSYTIGSDNNKFIANGDGKTLLKITGQMRVL